MKMWHILACVAAAGTFGPSSFGQGTVSLSNVSFPFTTIQAGQFAEVTITGAEPFGMVTVVQNGQPPFEFGTTDATGFWSTGPVLEDDSDVGDYSQTWFVNGVPVTPLNPNSSFFSFAPSLPSFEVSAGAFSQNVTALNSVMACGGNANVTATWPWTPVSYVSETSFDSSVVDAAATNWNHAQNKLTLEDSGAQNDIDVFDSTSLPTNVFAQTTPFSQHCGACSGEIDTCNGACLGDSAMWAADIALNKSSLDGLATARSVSANSEATNYLTHEFGHTLALGHEPIRFGVCSEVASVMADFGMFELCGITSPTSGDVDAFNGVYPNSPGFCTPGNNVCLGNPCQ